MGKVNKIQQITVAGAVCPVCFKPLQNPTIINRQKDRYNPTIRTCFGWCFECGRGCEVIQFQQYKKWHIHKYRLYTSRLNGAGSPCTPAGNWEIVCELPQLAPVIIGPGGEYDRPFEPGIINLMETVLPALKATVKTVESLLKLAKPK